MSHEEYQLIQKKISPLRLEPGTLLPLEADALAIRPPSSFWGFLPLARHDPFNLGHFL
jgi:hypothetical protein